MLPMLFIADLLTDFEGFQASTWDVEISRIHTKETMKYIPIYFRKFADMHVGHRPIHNISHSKFQQFFWGGLPPLKVTEQYRTF